MGLQKQEDLDEKGIGEYSKIFQFLPLSNVGAGIDIENFSGGEQLKVYGKIGTDFDWILLDTIDITQNGRLAVNFREYSLEQIRFGITGGDGTAKMKNIVVIGTT